MMSSEKHSETCSLVLVTLGCVQACFRVSFICLCIGRPGSPVRKASANVRECPGLSRRLMKCARRCHWSFWYQECCSAGFCYFGARCLSTLLIAPLVPFWWSPPLVCSPCPRASVFASVGPIVNSDSGFGWVISVGAGGPKWGADSFPLFSCMLD
ncbi:hypothetical protein CDL15_Pgr009163 [Punica granatum]|uniref:Uncharacterized protein n=1 Tax=Punica granatum TaxID=22663 RepID=A0A218WJ83_PUNGR|nr:hypothetical protein CDL15_Pgr009163 [Punica granatum]PKI72246.1 hypothetical protein CRG98_007320 [Punica granatum]